MFDDIISGQKEPLGWILRNFRLCMCTPKGTPNGSRDLRSLPVIIVLVLLYYILYYYYSRNKCGGKPGMRRTYFHDFRWCHFRSKFPTRAAIAQLPVTHAHNILPYRAISVTWLTWLTVAPLKYGLSCPHILLTWYRHFQRKMVGSDSRLADATRLTLRRYQVYEQSVHVNSLTLGHDQIWN